MPRADYKRCRQCKRHTSECGTLSHVRLCSDCGHRNFEEATDQQRAHSGPYFQLWRRRIVASAGGVIPDDTRMLA